MSVAWMFPGQGSQYPGMGRHLFRRYPHALEVLREAEAACGLPLEAVMLRGPAEQLRRSEVLEPALTALNIAYADFLREQGMLPNFVAGYSAGEVAALYCAGVIDRADALRIAALRGEALRDAAPLMESRMCIILRVPADAVASFVEELAARGTIAIAARNAPSHTTVVGDAETVLEAERWALAMGAEVGVVEVAGPWHCDLVEGASRAVLAALGGIAFRTPTIPISCSASGCDETDPERLRQNLAEQMHRPVLWWPILADWLGRNMQHVVEVGPGRFLGSVVKRACRSPQAPEVHFMERENGRAPSPERIAASVRS